MTALQCCCVRLAGTSAAATAACSSREEPRLMPQQSFGSVRSGVMNIVQHRKTNSFVLSSRRSSFRRVAPFGGGGFGRCNRRMPPCSAASADPPSVPDSFPSSMAESMAESMPADESIILDPEVEKPKSFWQNWTTKTSELRAKVSKWGLAAVLAYGLFDGVTYTTFFVLAFLGYEKSTGNNPAANIKALLGVVVLMWSGNNVTRPFRVAGAAAVAPVIDRGLKKVQEVLKLPNQTFAFMICVATFACLCFSVVGVLILSRLVVT